MRKWILGLVAVLALVVAPLAAVAEPEAVEVQYTSMGQAGLLQIDNAMGQVLFVTDSAGHVVAAGLVPSNSFTIPVIGAGPVLTVRVGAQITYVPLEWWHWE